MTFDQESAGRISRWIGQAPASPGRILGFDGLRGLAVLLVVGAHANLPFLRYGGLVGVQLFFVLSGFLITNVLANEQDRTRRIALRAFSARRLLRLLPALIVAIVGGCILAVAAGQPPKEIALEGAINLFYLGNLDIGTKVSNPFGHMWTIAMEEQFYLFWPLLLVAARRVPRAYVVALLLASAAASIFFRLSRDIGTADGYHTAYYSPFANVYALLLGCAAALWLRLLGGDTRLPQWVWKVSILTLLALASLPGLKDGLREVRSSSTLIVKMVSGTASTAAAVGLVVAVATATRLPGWLTSRGLVFFGTISYGLYLWHGILDWTLNRMTDSSLGGLLAGTTSAVLAVWVATLSYRHIESPFLARRDRFTP